MSRKERKGGRGRLTEIATVLGSYGFGHVYRTRLGSNKKETQDAEQLRLAFEELGPTFIKFGQILSTRPDLLPQDYINELSKLQDRVPPFSFDKIEETFREDFDKELEEVFEWVDEEPLASASVAQVHRARTFEGEEVIIKVQRPDMEENLLRDISLFSRILSMAPETVKSFVVDADVALDEIKKATEIELDFRNEVRALLQFQKNNENRPVVGVPRPLIEYTSKRVLVEEHIEGINGLNTTSLLQEGYDIDDFVEKFIYSFLAQIFEDGFFHGDPHPGNIIVKDGQIVYIDFGLYGELSAGNRDKLMEILEAIVFEDVEELMNLLLQMAIVNSDVDRFKLYEDLETFFYLYVSKDFDQIDIGTLFNDILSVTHEHGLIMPNDFILLAKSLGVVEGVVSNFKTNVNVMEVAKTYLKQRDDYSLLERFKRENVGIKMYQLAANTLDLPTSLKRTLETVTNGRTRLNIEIMDWDKKTIQINKMINRLVFAIIIAALVLASAIIIANVTSTGVSWLSVIIFVGAGLMGLWLLISIIRSGTL
jgi:ubiquinone biosynthesis protein